MDRRERQRAYLRRLCLRPDGRTGQKRIGRRRQSHRRGTAVFVDQGLLYDDLTELFVTKDMTERKAKMIELGDAFIAFPGGTGTLEEIAEIMSKVSLKQLDAPCILYNLNGYYDNLKALLDHMIAMGLSSPERQQGISFADNLAEIKTILQA